MKAWGLVILSVLGLITLVESMIFLIFGIFAQIGLLFAQAIVSAYGFRIFLKYDWKDLFYVDAELVKGNRIVAELWHQVLFTLASLLLMFPGIFSDVAGALILLDKVRQWMIEHLLYEKTL